MWWILGFILIVIAAVYYLCIWSPTQVFGFFPRGIKTGEKLIALTFDDGPNPPYTDELLDILAKHEVRATFFTPAKNLEKFPELARRIFAAGHVIGNHSYSHKFSNHFKTLYFETEINKAQTAVEKIIGRRPALYRPPWLFKQPWLLKNLAKHKLVPVSGYFASNWELWRPTAEQVFKDALKVVRPGRIIIFHDGFDTKGGYRAGSVGAIDLLIPELKRQGYKFLTADQLLQVAAYKTL